MALGAPYPIGGCLRHGRAYFLRCRDRSVDVSLGVRERGSPIWREDAPLKWRAYERFRTEAEMLRAMERLKARYAEEPGMYTVMFRIRE